MEAKLTEARVHRILIVAKRCQTPLINAYSHELVALAEEWLAMREEIDGLGNPQRSREDRSC